MRLAGKILSAIFALLAVPLFTVAACNLAIETAFLNRSTFDKVLEDDVIFADMLPVALPVIFTLPDAEGLDFEGRDESPIRFRDIVLALQGKPDVWEEVTSLLVPPVWLQTTITQFVDVLFAITEGDFDVINDTVDLSEVRQRFNGEEASQAAMLIISEAPACTEEQVAELETFFSQLVGKMPICNPTDEAMIGRSTQVLEFWFTALAQQLGEDQTSVSDLFELTRDNARTINLLAELDHQGLMLTYLCPMALLSLILIFAIRSTKSFGRWIGGISIVSGIIILVTIFALQVVAFNIVTSALSAETEAEQFFTRLFSEILRSVIAQSNSTMLLQAAIFIGIGFVIFVFSGFAGEPGNDGGSSVLITEDGEIISTATQRRIGQLSSDDV
jgi:hypothetical protein